ncbi:MAG: hypothetical protein K0R44_184 [Thermomicrobiales bacterium]|nr:hypothetical protein [Thermomicrobiales bacterium]
MGRVDSLMEKPQLDAFCREYARLSFAIERHVPGFIDAYLGPADVRAELDPDASTGALPVPQALVTAARELLARIPSLDATVGRKGYLTKQVEAMLAITRQLAGEELPYREEVRLLFDIEPVATPEGIYDAAISDLDSLLPGDGPIAERMIAWRQSYAIAPETARRLVDIILPELRARTEEFVDLPEEESIEIRMVQDQPWSGYNWYLGNGRSRVDLNTDLPIYAYRLTDLLAHEGYPGHHTEHALKERLYTEQGLGEHALQLINTPECVISEGIATLAEKMLFDPQELVRFRRERVYPAAGIAGDPEREVAIGAATRILRSVPGNAALLLHEEGREQEDVVAYLQHYGLTTEAEARQRLRFIADPLWRAYIFTYHVGYELMSNWLDQAPSERRGRFRTLLSDQVYPSQIAAWTASGTGPLSA